MRLGLYQLQIFDVQTELVTLKDVNDAIEALIELLSVEAMDLVEVEEICNRLLSDIHSCPIFLSL